MPPVTLDSTVQRAYQRMAADLRRVFGARFVALVAGPAGASAVAFADAIHAGDLDALAPLADRWAHDRLSAPLLVTPAEFRRSLDVFAAEYQALIDHHVVIDGTDPFEAATVNLDDLRRACEGQARGHLIHLRQGWIEHGGHAGGVTHVIEHSAAPLRQILSNLSRLDGEAAKDDAALASFAARRIGMPEDLISAVLSLDATPHRARTLAPRLPEYLAACEQLWSFSDAWRAR